jgi:hypothetical protein
MADFFDPEADFRVYRRTLPHWRQAGVTYFVTFHLADSLPTQKLATLKEEKKRWLALNPPPHKEKSFSASKINKMTGSRGPMWHWESFAHIVRNASQLARIERYIRDNPKSLPIDRRAGMG